MKTRKELEQSRDSIKERAEDCLERFEAELEGFFVPISKDEMAPLKEVYEKLKERNISLFDALDISGERLYERDDTGAYQMRPLRQIYVLRMRYNRYLELKAIWENLQSVINYRGDGEEVPAFAKPKLDSIFRYLASIGYRIK